MKFLVLILWTLAVSAQKNDNLIWRYGERQIDDHVIGTDYQKQGPFAENQTVTFEFEHPLDGKYCTAFTLTGEDLYGSRVYTGSIGTSARAHLNISSSQGHEIWFTVYGYDYSPGPIYP